MALQIRRGTDTQRQALSGPNTPIAGELLYSTDNKKLHIGDGTTTGGTSIGYFGSVAVSGQSTIRSTGTNETLTIVAGANISLVTDSNTGTLTIAAAPQELNNGSLRLFQNNLTSINSNEDINIDPAGTGKVNVTGNLTATSLTGPLTGNVTGNADTVTNGVYTTDTGTVTNTMLAGSIDNNKLVNNSLTIGSTNVSLGSTSTTLSGLSSVTSESATVGNISISQNNIRTATSNSNLVFDTSGTGRIELRSPTEGSRLELYTDFVGSGLFIANNSATNAGFVLINSHDTASLSPTYVPAPLGSSQVGAPATYGRSRGNALFPSAVSNNDELMVFDFLGYTDATDKLKSAAKLKIIADSSPSAGNIAGRFEFVTTSSTGAVASRLTVTSTAVTSAVPVKLAVYADATARDAAITSPTAGMMIFLTAGTKFQGYTGSAWVDLN